LIHNHPSGDSRPSDEDIRLTKMFVSAGQFMGIPVLDHIVIGDNEFTSLSEIGKLS
ncbi:MAG: JAB domain-containing protein, partial [Veillonella parvula]|nr:JAB domain-containing protein [Veillonella parvula]